MLHRLLDEAQQIAQSLHECYCSGYKHPLLASLQAYFSAVSAKKNQPPINMHKLISEEER